MASFTCNKYSEYGLLMTYCRERVGTTVYVHTHVLWKFKDFQVLGFDLNFRCTRLSTAFVMSCRQTTVIQLILTCCGVKRAKVVVHIHYIGQLEHGVGHNCFHTLMSFVQLFYTASSQFGESFFKTSGEPPQYHYNVNPHNSYSNCLPTVNSRYIINKAKCFLLFSPNRKSSPVTLPPVALMQYRY